MASTSITGWTGAGDRTMTLTAYGSNTTDTTWTCSMRVDISGGLPGYTWFDSYLGVWEYDSDQNKWYKVFEGTSSAGDAWYTKINEYGEWSDVWNRTTATRHIRIYIYGWARAGSSEEKNSYVSLEIPPKTSYTISYNGNSTYNGYTSSTISNLPDSGKKWYGDTAYISQEIPTKADTTSNGSVVTLNYNYSGSTNSTLVPTDIYTYTFSKWNTSSNGTGTNYNPGSSYTTNGAITFYAVWNRTKTRGSVILPTPIRQGFTFLGWSTDSSADTGDYAGGDEYTPAGATTLYAIWRANLGNAYVLKTTIPNVTWQTLITEQSTVGSTLYDAGGQYSGWGYDGNYVTCFGKRIKYNNSYVLKTSTPVRGGTYYYYE